MMVYHGLLTVCRWVAISRTLSECLFTVSHAALSLKGVVHSWAIAAAEYHADYGTNYYNDLVEVHEAFGLTARYKSAVAIATLVSSSSYQCAQLML